MLRQFDGKTIRLGGSLLAFDKLDAFTFHLIEEDGPYGFLQSEDDENIGFVVASPFSFIKDYHFELEDKDREQLQLTSQEEALVLGIITMKEPFKDSTINLVAPIVVNVSTLSGLQLVLPPSYEYDTKTPLFARTREESGETSC